MATKETPKAQKDDLEAVKLVVQALEGFDPVDQERIIRWASEKIGLKATPAAVTASPTPTVPTSANSHAQDIKSFMASKNPRSDNQFATAVAYYYKFEAPTSERKDTITAEDLQEACRQTGRKRLKSPGQTLINALHSGLLNKGGQRGTYLINTVGENLVAMALPGSQNKQ